MVNIKEVAERARVSTATVSRVLNGHSSCTEATKSKVNRVIVELGYQPNSIAKSLRLQRTGTFITVLNDIRNPVFAGMIKGMEDVAYKSGYSMLIGNTDNSTQREDDYLRHTLSKKADGIVLITPRVEMKSVIEFSLQMPVVLINDPREQTGIPVVGIDDFAAVWELSEHVIALGHRSIAYITGDDKAAIAKKRLDAFIGCTRKHCHVDVQIVPGGTSMQHGRDAMSLLLGSGKRPSCVLCYNDELAIGAMKLVQENGMQIPRDIAFCGFDDIPTASLTYPSLTTVHQPTYDIGAKAAHILMGLLEGAAPVEMRVNLPFKICPRASTGE